MKLHVRYFSYLLRHKYHVFVAGLRTGASLWRLVVHDWSKLLPSEWLPYARKWYGGPYPTRTDRNNVLARAANINQTGPTREQVSAAYEVSHLRHVQRNDHHWNHWLLVEGRGKERALPMPEASVREMIADWIGCGIAKSGADDLNDWVSKNAASFVFHPETADLLHNILNCELGYERAATAIFEHHCRRNRE